MLTGNDRSDLKFAMQAAVLEDAAYTGNVVLEGYIKNEMTYEQLLNVCFNEKRDEVYMESALLENVAQQFILDLVYEGNEQDVPKTAIDKYNMLESVLYEAGPPAHIRAKQAATAAANAPKPGKIKQMADATKGALTTAAGKTKEAAVKAAGKTIDAAKVAAQAIKDNPKKSAAIGAGALAAGVTAWYLYRKLRKSGAEKAEAAKAAAEAAEKRAKATGSAADAKKAAKWRARAERYAKQA